MSGRRKKANSYIEEVQTRVRRYIAICDDFNSIEEINNAETEKEKESKSGRKKKTEQSKKD